MAEKMRRRSYIVNRNFQLRYVAIVTFLLLAATILVGVNIYYQMGRLVIENSQVVGIASFLKSINVTLALWGAFIILLIIFFGLFISHRIAGPLKRLEDSIIKVGQGDLSKYARIRKSDEFRELIDVFNKMVINLRQLVLKDKDLVAQLARKLEHLSEQLKKETLTKQEIHTLHEELHKLMSTVNEIATGFKL